MRLDHLFARQPQTLSFEFFPPKTDRAWHTLEDTIDQLSGLGPDFVSVTYGAGGSTRARTREIIEHIQAQTPLTAMAHLTCVGATKDEIRALLDEYAGAGIANILALRGDPPRGSGGFTPTPGGCRYASELMELVAADGRFALVGAAYPEGHPEAADRFSDWKHLLHKFDAGACAAITQCVFVEDEYLELQRWASAQRPDARIIPGILPVTDFAAVKRFCSFCGAKIPDSMSALLEPLLDQPVAMRAAGIQFTIALCRRLLEAGAPGIHIYALNRSTATAEIVTSLRDSGHLSQPCSS
ncbi:MAG: methylenetetrahydrofolate reductase [NAD(P)H] [Planctomycetota bacterium]|nr:MAG: methylenetetrahydrofolate reductase [NAD(P)H] [Planctomycetota bacterium]